MISGKNFLFLIVLLVGTASLFVTKCNGAAVELPLVQAVRIAKDDAQAKLDFVETKLDDLKSRVAAKECRSARIVESAEFTFQECLYDLKLHAQLLLHVISLFEGFQLEALFLMDPFFIRDCTIVSACFLRPFVCACSRAQMDCQNALLVLSQQEERYRGQSGEGLATEAYESFLLREGLLVNARVNLLHHKKLEAKMKFHFVAVQFVPRFGRRL